jgi:ankyrin repeat protein
LDDDVDRDKIEDFPLARYAAQYWATHARVENVSSRMKDGMECLFDADKPHFATWLWIYNEDQNGDSMSTKCPEKPEAVPLYYAARLGFCDLAKHLIAEHPEHVNARGGSRVTPMHIAAREGHLDILSLLLEHGADLEGRAAYNMTPLHVASGYGKLEAGQWLLDHGANINARDRDDWTPLRWALTEENNIQVVRLLLERGADVNAPDKGGTTVSQRATEQEVVELLSKYGTQSVE